MLGKVFLISVSIYLMLPRTCEGLPENSTDPSIDSIDVGNVTVKDIKDFVRLFFYRKNHPQFINSASFAPNGREVVQIKLTDQFDSNLDTKFIIHGWLNNKNSLQFQQLKEAYHASADYNIFIVDWSEISEDINYMRVANLTRVVGMYVAEKIQELIDEGQANASRIHVIGHSLGAHIAGFAGAQIKSPQLYRITGLDPALPNFQRFRDPDLRLDPSDAAFVDIIHTSGGTLGNYAPIGMADFYVNGGTPPQPGCGGISELASICSHGRAVEYFLESVHSRLGFWGLACPSWFAYKAGDCRGDFVEMGERASPHKSGSFYLGTNYQTPFAMGKKIFFEQEPFWRSTLNSIIHQSST